MTKLALRLLLILVVSIFLAHRVLSEMSQHGLIVNAVILVGALLWLVLLCLWAISAD